MHLNDVRVHQLGEGTAAVMYTALFSSQVATAHGYSLFRKKLTRGSLSVIKNAIYDAWERLSSDATRSFAVKFPRYAETVVRAWVNRV